MKRQKDKDLCKRSLSVRDKGPLSLKSKLGEKRWLCLRGKDYSV